MEEDAFETGNKAILPISVRMTILRSGVCDNSRFIKLYRL